MPIENVWNDEQVLCQLPEPEAGAIGVVYAFPNEYSVGITSLGYQCIWASLAGRKDVRVSRYFTDLHESYPRTVELLGFSFAWELDYGNILQTLEKLSVPILASDRGDQHPFVFGGGAVLTANPEPFAEWFDVILLGDGEELVGNFVSAFAEVRGSDRQTILLALAQVAGIYIPALYAVEYGGEALRGISPTHGAVPSFVQKQTYRGNALLSSTVVTPRAAWQNIFMVEVVRSCPEMCRFCLASYLTLPFRSASLENSLIPAIDRGLQYTDRLGLLGASITQHPQFAELLDWLDRPQYDRVRLSLASVRTNTLTTKLASILARHDSRSVTVAVESGSERLRQVINKKLTNEEIQAGCANAQAGGLQALKLYGMVGVPTEQMSDLDATVAMFKQAKKTAPQLKLTFGCSTFVPKAHTPWQWLPVDPSSEKKLQYLQKKLAPMGIEFRPESYRDSLLQAVISRGDRRLGQLLRLAYGFAQAEGKTEPSLGIVKRAFKELKQQLPPLEWYVFERWSETTILPWQHLRTGLPVDFIFSHYQQSFAQASQHNEAGLVTA